MHTRFASAVLICSLLSGLSRGAGSADADTVSRLGQSKHTLVEGIRQAAKTQGAPISAKFEFEDGKFWLSVYTAKAGIGADAEHNTLLELKGEPIAAAWNPGIEVFEDKKHLTRSAMQLTLLQQSRLDLAALVEKAASSEKGIPYSAIPTVKNGTPVLVIKFAAPDGASHSVDVALRP
ncbi:MAG TPA: hypothetical protein VFU13_22790 [Steroidobacteraceae bacterium]|nr:hypothetical protein [Steroidobacteraceae bacterium]